MQQTLISKTTRQGKVLVITFDAGVFAATLDGVEIARDADPGYRTRVNGELMHVFARAVGLTYAEGDVLRKAWTAAAAPYVPTRADLVMQYQALIDEQSAAYERAHNRQDARAMAIRESYETRIAAALDAIYAFDKE